MSEILFKDFLKSELTKIEAIEWNSIRPLRTMLTDYIINDIVNDIIEDMIDEKIGAIEDRIEDMIDEKLEQSKIELKIIPRLLD